MLFTSIKIAILNLMKATEKEILDQLISGTRFVGIVSDTPYVNDFVLKHDLDSTVLPTEIVQTVQSCIVASKKKINEVLTKEDLIQVGFPEYEESLLEIFANIQNVSICEAFKKIQTIFIKKNYSSPEIDIIYGLLFGYKICDIRYYIQTRDMGMPHHELEIAMDKKIGDRERVLDEQYVRCEKCTLEYLKQESILRA